MKYLHIFTLLLVMVGILSSNEVTHVVGRGETIFSISRLYSVTADDLMKANGITDPSRLSLGRRLVIPVTSAQPVSAQVVPQNLTDYRAVRGDTLFSIARTHGISLAVLLEINNFAPNHALKAGDVIRVPAAAGNNNRPVTPVVNTPVNTATGIFALNWPVSPKNITYMTGQMGVVVEGERLESVKSLTQGNVVSAGPWRKYGRVVIVEAAGGYYYMYGGLETLSVNVGTRITPGMEVGKLGVNSVSDKPQLFFMVFRNDTPIDPALAPRSVQMGSLAKQAGTNS